VFEGWMEGEDQLGSAEAGGSLFLFAIFCFQIVIKFVSEVKANYSRSEMFTQPLLLPKFRIYNGNVISANGDVMWAQILCCFTFVCGLGLSMSNDALTNRYPFLNFVSTRVAFVM
jgi:hypothetical protein